MATLKPTVATCCIWLTLLAFCLSGPAAGAAPPAEDPVNELAVLETLVGSWVFGANKQDGFSARQECKWILNKQFLEIETQVLRPGQPPASWRTLVTYDPTSKCYRRWKFSDKGEVSTAEGAWNKNTSTLMLSGRTPSGHDSNSSVEISKDGTMTFSEREFLDDKQTTMAVVGFTLRRVPPAEDQQRTK